VNCSCGWGGTGHLGTRNDGRSITSSFAFIPKITGYAESFVNPNARCPVCGESVFFYQSPSGGRVFFDELGPPWRKHPCTNNESMPSPITPEYIQPTRVYHWQSNRWQPFLLTGVRSVSRGVIALMGLRDGTEIRVLVHDADGQLRSSIDTGCLAHLRESGANIFELSVVNLSGRARHLRGCSFASDLKGLGVSTKRKAKSLKKAVMDRDRSDGTLEKVRRKKKIKPVRALPVNDLGADGLRGSMLELGSKRHYIKGLRGGGHVQARKQVRPKNPEMAEALIRAGLNNDDAKESR
jgi:hypothetical protein